MGIAKTKGIATSAVVAVIVIIAIAGIISYWVWSSFLSKPGAATIKSWEAIDDEGVPRLKLVVDGQGALTLHLSDPDYNLIDTGYLTEAQMEDGRETSVLTLAGYRGTPMNGMYGLVVKSGERTVCTQNFFFMGADLKVISCTPSWTGGPYLGYVHELSVDVKNDGDLPTYVKEMQVDIDGHGGDFTVLEGGIAPGQSKTISPFLLTMISIPSGIYTMNLTLKDYAGNIVATYSSGLSISS